MSPGRVLVTGAAGFVGRAIAVGFEALGWEVTGIDRAFDDGGVDRVQCIAADLAGGVPSDVPEVDLVVHAAWVTTDPVTLGVTRAEYLALNLRPLLSVLEHTTRTGVAAFVFLSSSGVFAPGDAVGGLTDADRPSGTSPYAAAKRAAEVLVSGASGERTAVHVVRLGYLYGPGEVARPSRRGVSLIAGWVAEGRAGVAPTVREDDPAREWTFTVDLAGALERLVDHPPTGGPLHLGSPHVHHDGEVARLIASRLPCGEPATVPAGAPVKPPMVPSDVPTLRDYVWTDLRNGLDLLLEAEVVV